jgi:hypothetical protein
VKTDGTVQIPEVYLRFHKAGLTSRDPKRRIFLSEFRWLVPAEIKKWDFYTPLIPHFVPFAATPGHDTFCWWQDGNERSSGRAPTVTIVSSPHDCEEAEIICETFEEFLIWALLEEARRSDLANQLGIAEGAVGPLLLEYVSRLEGFLPKPPAQAMRDMFARPTKPGKNRSVSLITDQEYKAAIKKFVGFKRRGETFVQYADA